MAQTARPMGIVFTYKAHCRDCYRCLRVCPVKAIRMHDGQAHVEPDRCIACGTCIRECPQKAKSFRNDVQRAADLVAGNAFVAASVAPSFAALFNEWQRKRLPSALRELGFAYVGETAIGAHPVAVETARHAAAHPNRPHVCSSCPAVVSYIERYQGELTSLLAPVLSPMLAHARHIRQTVRRDAKVVFIGPCIAKKAEAERPEHAGLVDCVLTFSELLEWLERRGVDMARCEESGFDEQPVGVARLFPLAGGALRTGGLASDLLSSDSLAVSGFEELSAALDGLRQERRPIVVEPLFCTGGCVNGPAMPAERPLYLRRSQVMRYGHEPPDASAAGQGPSLQLAARFAPRGDRQRHVPPSEQRIREVLETTGKSSPADELNCGACGYASCRDKAIAVLDGMAEPQMCIPHMRRLAERRTDRIIETSPNGIVILDDRLNILSMNPAFRRFFMCTDAVCGKRISYLMDPHLFEQLATGQRESIEQTVRHDKYNLVCHQICYALRGEQQLVGIFVNITRSQADREKLSRLRSETMTQARDLLAHQVSMAQKIAQFLGESTAHGEQLVENLITLASEETADAEPRKDWPWPTSTSK